MGPKSRQRTRARVLGWPLGKWEAALQRHGVRCWLGQQRINNIAETGVAKHLLNTCLPLSGLSDSPVPSMC